MEVFMKIKGIKVILFVLVGMVLLTSCGLKKYAGFEVQDGFIMLPVWDEDTQDVFPFPLELYKFMESELKEVVSVFNKFDTVSEIQLKKFFSHLESFEDLDIYSFEDYPEDTQDALEELIKDSELIDTIMSSLKTSKPYLDFIDDIVCDYASDIIESIIYPLEILYEFNNGLSDNYKSKEEIFTGFINSGYEYFADFHKTYFPHIKIETDYSKIGK